MPNPCFTPDELARLESRIEATPAWVGWHRRAGTHGEDVVEVTVQDGRRATLSVAKAPIGYVATGFDGWSLTVCDDLDELLGILAAWRPRPHFADASDCCAA